MKLRTPFRAAALAVAALSAALPADSAAADSAPVGKTNRWVRREGADARASVAENWSLGHVPTENETVLFSARNPASAVWDEAAPHRIGGLVVEPGWLAVLTVETSLSGPAKSLEIAGDASILGGAVTHPQCGEDARWALVLDVGGDLEIGENALVSVSGKGFAPGCGPSPGQRPGWGASHGGQGAPRAMDGNGRPALCPGSFVDPSLPGSGGTVAPGSDPRLGHGGGVVRLSAAGAVSVLGKIRADADSRDTGNALLGGAAGGSVLVRAGRIFSFGENASITADGGAAFREGGGGGGGGRIAVFGAVEEKKPGLDRLATSSNDIRKRIHAWGGVGATNARSSVDADSHLRAAAGTAYFETTGGPDDIPGSGALCVYDRHRTSLASTRIPGDSGAPDQEAVRDGTLALLDTAFVALCGPVTVKSLGFGGGLRTNLDLNGCTVLASSVWTQNSSRSFDEPGTHRSNDNKVFDSVTFSGGTIVLRPYFKPVSDR